MQEILDKLSKAFGFKNRDIIYPSHYQLRVAIRNVAILFMVEKGYSCASDIPKFFKKDKRSIFRGKRNASFWINNDRLYIDVYNRAKEALL